MDTQTKMKKIRALSGEANAILNMAEDDHRPLTPDERSTVIRLVEEAYEIQQSIGGKK